MKQTNLRKKILINGLALKLIGDLVSGMLFGVGYLVVDRFNDWVDTPAQSSTAAHSPKASTLPTTVSDRR